MAALVARSLELLPPFQSTARPNRRGYLYVGEEAALAALAEKAPHAGPLRIHRQGTSYPQGAREGLNLLRAGALVDGGYYVRTPENRPFLGPVAEGVYLLGAFSGYGVMAALGAGELLARWVAGEALPSYAQALAPGRYRDPSYQPPLEAAQAQL